MIFDPKMIHEQQQQQQQQQSNDDRRTSEISSDRFGSSTDQQPRPPPRQKQRWRQSQSFVDQINAYLNRNDSSTAINETVIATGNRQLISKKSEQNHDIYVCDVIDIDDVEQIAAVSYFTDHVTTGDNVHRLYDQNPSQENFTAQPENVAVFTNHNDYHQDDHTTTTTAETIAKHNIVEREIFSPKTNDHRRIHGGGDDNDDGDVNNDLLGYSASPSTTSTSLKLENRNCSSHNHHHHYRFGRYSSDHCGYPNHSDSFVWCNQQQPLPPVITSTILADETETVDASKIQPGCVLLNGLSGRILTTTTTTALLNDNSDFHSDSSKLNDKNKPTATAATIISVANPEEKEKKNQKFTETSCNTITTNNNNGNVSIDDNIVLIKLNANGKDVFMGDDDDDDDETEPTKKSAKPFFLENNCTDNNNSSQQLLRYNPKYFDDFKATIIDDENITITPPISTLLNSDKSFDKIKGYTNSDVVGSDALDEILSVEIPSTRQQSDPIIIISNNDKNHQNHDLKKEFLTLLSIQPGCDHHVYHNNNDNNNSANRCESKCWHSIQSSSSSSSTTPSTTPTPITTATVVAKSNTTTTTKLCLSDANTKINDNSNNHHSHPDRPGEGSNRINSNYNNNNNSNKNISYTNNDQISANQSTKRDTKLLPSSVSTSCDQFFSCRPCLHSEVSSTSTSHIALPFGQQQPETITTTTTTLDENINKINEFVHYRSTKIDVGVLDVEKSCSSFITDYSQTTTTEVPAASIQIGHNFEARIDDHSCYVEHHSKQQMKIMVRPKGILILSKQNDACPNETKTKFEKNNNNHDNQSHNNGRIYRKKPKKNIKFADGDAEIIGYRFSSDDEDDDDLELETETILSGQSAATVAAAAAVKAISNPDPLDSFDLDDDEHDLERLELKKLTESNTLFNSNYGNFKCLNEGVLGRPKSEDTNGAVKFQIFDSYQKPLTETMTSTNSIRKMFEKNGSASPKTTATSPAIAQGQHDNDNDGQISNKISQNRVKNNNQVQIPKVRLGKSNANIQNNQGNHRTLIDKVELDIDKIRIPRASIQHQTVDKCDEINRQKSHLGNHESSSLTAVADNNDNNKNNDDNNVIDGPIDTDHKLSDSVILVDNREGSILTLDCKNISKIDPNDANNELFYLPAVMVNDDRGECTKKTKNKSTNGIMVAVSNDDDNNNNNVNTNNDDNSGNSANNCNNLDSLSQSSAESSTSSGCSSERSSSPQSTTSPINLENCCPSSSPPDSLDSSVAHDSYDSNNVNQTNHDSMNLVDEIKSESMIVKGQSSADSSDFVHVLRSSENEMDKDVGEKRQDNNLDCSTIQWSKMVDGELKTNGPPTAPARKSSSSTNREESVFRHSSAEQQQEDKTTKNDLSTTMVDNGKNIANENENLKQQPVTMEDKRNQKLVQMALDLQRHRNNNIINNETSSSLSRSDSNQSSVNSRKSFQNSSESFRERLLREAFEESIFESTTKERQHRRRRNHKKQSKHSFFNVADSPGGSTLSEDSDGNNESDSGEEQQQHKFFCENGSDSSKTNSDNSGDDGDGDGDEGSDKASSHGKVFGAKKPFSKIFKNMKNAVNPNKKYTKMMKVNLSKTSKFIVNTTQHFRNETSDMVKKLKNDKRSCDSSIFYPTMMMDTNGEENHGDRSHNDTDFDRQSNSDKKSKMMFKHQNDPRIKSASIEPTLVKIKRLGSTKYFQNDKDVARFTMSNEDLGVLSEEKPPCAPPRCNSKTSIFRALPDDHLHQEQPPKAPARKKKLIKRTSLTLDQLKADFEQNFKIMENASITKSLDSHLKVLERSKSILGKDYRLQQCLVRSNNCEANLLTSNTFWVTCYDQDFRIHHYQGSPCRLLATKWNCFLKISAFCDRLNQMPSDEHRKSLVDSIVLQLYTVLAQFETRTKNAKIEDATSQKPLTVGQIIDAIVGVSFVNSGDRDTNGENHQRRIDDVLLLLPAKQMDMKDEDPQSSESESWHTEQAFYLQVFLMRLTRLITTNNNNNYNSDEMIVSKKNSHSRPNHSENVSKRSNMFSSLNELRILATVDVFNILDDFQLPTIDPNAKESDSIRERIECWFRERRNLKFIERFYEIDPVQNQLIFKPSSVLDYLQIDFVLNHDSEETFQLVLKDSIMDSY